MDLSVIIPVYNVEKYLASCIRSLYDQSLSVDEFEVIIINDGSTDGSGTIAERCAEMYPNIRIINQENQGLSATRNRGVLSASGDYLFFLDSDDFVYPNMLNFFLDIVKKNELDILRFDYWAVNEDGEKLFQSSHINKRKQYANRVEDGLFMFEKIYNREFFACLSLIKKSFLLSSGISFAEGMFFEDIEYAIKMSLAAKRIMYVPSCAYAYRQRSTSILHTFDKKKAKDIINIVSNLQLYLTNKSIHNSFKNSIKENITQLMVSVFLRIAESSLYSDRKELFDLIEDKGVSHLYPAYNLRDFIVPCLYNIVGRYIVVILYPVTRLRMALLKEK